jgi:hypothetical protein
MNRRRHLSDFFTMSKVLPRGSDNAVADGGAAWYIRRSVSGRAMRFAYGMHMAFPYDASDVRHKGRKVYKDLDGDWVHGVWGLIVAKVSLIKIILLVCS